jgi:hypothetical protein
VELGSGIGALVGGIVYDRLGAVWLFEASAFLSAISASIALLAYLLLNPPAPTEQIAFLAVAACETEVDSTTHLTTNCDDLDESIDKPGAVELTDKTVSTDVENPLVPDEL